MGLHWGWVYPSATSKQLQSSSERRTKPELPWRNPLKLIQNEAYTVPCHYPQQHSLSKWWEVASYTKIDAATCKNKTKQLTLIDIHCSITYQWKTASSYKILKDFWVCFFLELRGTCLGRGTSVVIFSSNQFLFQLRSSNPGFTVCFGLFYLSIFAFLEWRGKCIKKGNQVMLLLITENSNFTVLTCLSHKCQNLICNK